MISMGIVILISSVVVNGQESQDFPVKMDDLYEKADKNCSILQGRSEWVVDDQSMNNETARNKRQIACCYGNQYPIITLPSCSIPYTIINGTCYLATCPKPCDRRLLGHHTCMNHSIRPYRLECQPVRVEIRQGQLTQKTKGNTTTTSGVSQGSAVPAIFPPSIKPSDDSILSSNSEMHTYSNHTTPSTISTMAPTTTSTTPTTTSTTPTTTSTTPPSITTTLSPTTEGTTPGKQVHNCSYISFFCGNNSTPYNMYGTHKNECQVCPCVYNPVYCEPELQLGVHRPVDNFLGNINHDVSGYPTCCSYSDNTQGLPKKETAGLMRGSGNGEGGNTIISNVNILAGPSCEDPCGSQNACMLSHSGNGDGGNKIVANANYINGGNLLCCSGNGRGGNCIRTMVNIVGGNSARVLSSCDGQLLKHMCDFLATDFCTTKTANVSDPTTEPTTEPTTVPTTEPTTEPITKPTTESTQTTEPISEPPQTTELNTEPTNTSTPLTEPPKTDETPSQVRRSAGPNITKEDRLDTTDGITPVTSQLCGPHTFLRQPNYCVPRCPPPNYFLFPSKNTYC